MVPRQAPLEGVSPAARRRLPIDHAALVVLRERSPGFLEDRRRGKAPALDAAGPIEVGQEVGFKRGPVGEGAGQIGDVVLQLGVVPHGRHLRRGRDAKSQLARGDGRRGSRH